MENLKAIIVFLLFWSIVTYRVGVYTILFVELFMHPIHIFCMMSEFEYR